MQFVGRDRQEVYIEFRYVDGYLPEPLDGVALEQGAILPRQARKFLHRLNCSGLIVRQHYRDEQCIVAERVFQLCRLDDPVTVDRQEGKVESLSFKCATGGKYGWMLDAACDYVPAPCRRRSRCPDYGQIVPFRAAGGKEYPARRAVEALGKDAPGSFHCFPRAVSRRMDT